MRKRGRAKELPIIGLIGKLRIEKGDIIVLSLKEEISSHHVAVLRDAVEGSFPGHKAIVLMGGMTMSVVHEATA